MDKTSSKTLKYEEYLQIKEQLLKEFGESGFVLYTENRAFLCFDTLPDMRFYITKDSVFSKSDFQLDTTKFQIIGRSKKEFGGTIDFFLEDIKNNRWKILCGSFVFILFFNPIWFNLELLLHINEILIDIVSIFLGMLFVFIGFFYGDKERTIEVYKKGRCDKEFFTDKYVIILSFIAILLLIFSVLVGNSYSVDLPQSFMEYPIMRTIINYKVKYIICFLATYCSLIVLIICFDSLINYYLKTMRNKYLIDAVDNLMEERIKKNK